MSRIAQAEQRPWVATVGGRRPPPLPDAEGGSEAPMDISKAITLKDYSAFTTEPTG